MSSRSTQTTQVFTALQDFPWECLSHQTWDNARSKVLAYASGKGLSDFLTDKVLVSLLLNGVVNLQASRPVTGPGALATLHVVKHFLIDRGEWSHTFAVKPAKIPPSALRDLAGMDSGGFLDNFCREIRVLGRIYLEQRVRDFPSIRPAASIARRFLEEDGASLEGEYILCEIGRRRACSLYKAYCKREGIQCDRMGKNVPLRPEVISLRECSKRSIQSIRRIANTGETLVGGLPFAGVRV